MNSSVDIASGSFQLLNVIRYDVHGAAFSNVIHQEMELLVIVNEIPLLRYIL